jgi:hypothetical protein
LRIAATTMKLFTVFLLLVLANSAFGDNGSTSASVGHDVVIETPPKKPSEPASAAAASPKSGSLGRRGGPQQRQDDPPGILNPNLLPFCVPGNGVVCSDRDYTGFLGTNPANIDLSDDNLGLFGVVPSVEVSQGTETKLDLYKRTLETSLLAKLAAEVKAILGTRVASAGTESTTTAAGVELKSRQTLPLLKSIDLTLGQIESENKVEVRDNKPNFWYVFGQNFGLPVGLPLAADEVAGK